MTDDTVKADEPTLRYSEEPFRAIVDSAADAIVSADATGRIRSWNGAAGRMFGYRADEVIGRPLTILMPEGVRQAHERGVDRFRHPRRLAADVDVRAALEPVVELGAALGERVLHVALVRGIARERGAIGIEPRMQLESAPVRFFDGELERIPVG